MEENYPPYTITNKMINCVSKIMEKVGEANYFIGLNEETKTKTRIKSIHSSLAIENNQLSLFQVEDVINGKPVIRRKKRYSRSKKCVQCL